MKQNVLKLTIFIVNGLYNNQIETSHDAREILRTKIINSVERKNDVPRFAQSKLTENIEVLLCLDSRYATGEINFQHNRTLLNFFIFHKRFDLLSMLTKNIMPTQLVNSTKIGQSTTSSVSTTPKSNSCLCKKSSLACAFTCDSSTCDRW